jgi:hypothetical protein
MSSQGAEATNLHFTWFTYAIQIQDTRGLQGKGYFYLALSYSILKLICLLYIVLHDDI